jgi:hypothetical protein
LGCGGGSFYEEVEEVDGGEPAEDGGQIAGNVLDEGVVFQVEEGFLVTETEGGNFPGQEVSPDPVAEVFDVAHERGHVGDTQIGEGWPGGGSHLVGAPDVEEDVEDFRFPVGGGEGGDPEEIREEGLVPRVVPLDRRREVGEGVVPGRLGGREKGLGRRRGRRGVGR